MINERSHRSFIVGMVSHSPQLHLQAFTIPRHL
jgi:hypothetical protein